MSSTNTQPKQTHPIPKKIVIASRESALAMWQAEFIQSELQGLYPQTTVEILGMTTRGDQILDQPLAKIGGKGLFIKELETALLDGRADIAVHSMKDVPMTMPEGFILGATCERHDPRDAFVSNQYDKLEDLPAGSIVGTSSLRRQSQIKAKFPQLKIHSLRGNVQTRLRKLDEGQYDAIILAAAGLKRLGLGDRVRYEISPEQSIPAVGQGALAIEICENRPDLLPILAPLNHAQTDDCTKAERAMSRALAGSCSVPLGGFAQCDGDALNMVGFVASEDGKSFVKAQLTGPRSAAEDLGSQLAQQLIDQGAAEILAAIESD